MSDDPIRDALLRELACRIRDQVAANLAVQDAQRQLTEYDQDVITDRVAAAQNRAMRLRAEKLHRLHLARMPLTITTINADER